MVGACVMLCIGPSKWPAWPCRTWGQGRAFPLFTPCDTPLLRCGHQGAVDIWGRACRCVVGRRQVRPAPGSRDNSPHCRSLLGSLSFCKAYSCQQNAHNTYPQLVIPSDNYHIGCLLDKMWCNWEVKQSRREITKHFYISYLNTQCHITCFITKCLAACWNRQLTF